MKCSICNRPLSDPKSVERGIGPICWQKILSKMKQPENSNQHLIPGFDGDVICKRGEGWNISTNVPQIKVAIRQAIISSCKKVFRKGKQFYSFPTTTLSKIVQKATDEVMKIQAN